MNKHLQLMGFKAKDLVTGFEGVVSSISFDLYGCVCGLLTPAIDKDGKLGDSHWYDVKRLELTSSAPVMPVPDFDAPEIGAAEKPVPGI